MNWESLKVYHPLKREELKPAYKDFIGIIANNLFDLGFKLYNGKLIRLSNDLIQVIYIDTRGSWSGAREHFKTTISLFATSDKSPFIRKWEPLQSRKLEEIAVGIRDHYRITQEYKLLADFLTRKIKEYILPYFEKYNSSEAVLVHCKDFDLHNVVFNDRDLILFSELQNQKNNYAYTLIESMINRFTDLNNESDSEYLNELLLYKKGIEHGDWAIINEKLAENRNQVLSKLRTKK